MTRNIWLLLLLLTLNIPALGQEFPMLHFTVNDGLPSNSIYQVFRDSKGYIWLATDKGVVRYNGVRFETFTTFNGLSDNEVFFFQEDAYGRMWLATFNGQLCYYKNDSFHTRQNTAFLRLPFRSPHIYAIIPEQDSSLTFNFYDKKLVLNIKDTTCTYFRTDKVTDACTTCDVVCKQKVSDDRYELVLGCIDRPASRNIIVDTQCNIIKSTRNGYVVPKVLSNQNNYFILDSTRVMARNGTVLAGAMTDMNKKTTYCYYNDGVDHFFGTHAGLLVNNTLQLFKQDDVSSITQDGVGNYFVGTLKNGVYVLRNNFMKTAFLANRYSGEVKYSHTDGQEAFFVTSENDLFGITGKNIRPIFNYQAYIQTPYKKPTDAAYLINGSYDYFSLYDHDLIILRDIRAKRSRMERYSDRIPDRSIKSVLTDNDIIYIRGRDMIWTMNAHDVKKNDLQQIALPEGEARIFGMGKSQAGDIWYSTLNAVYKLHSKSIIAQPQFRDRSFKYFEIYGKDLVAYTHLNQLLICWDIDSGVDIDTVPQQNCIWNKFYKLDASHILISTDNLYRVLTLRPGNSKRRYEIATIEDPFVPLHAENICADTSTCYFFSDHNITALDIQSLLKKAKAPTLYFSSLRVGKRTYSIGKVFTIAYDQARSVSINFATLSPAGKTFFYQYSISKNDEDHWHDLGGERIDLFDPGYGSYMIKVRARSVASDYCVPISFVLGIGKPYWATWWFIVLIIVALAGIIVFVARQRIAYALRRSRQAHDTEVKFMRSEYKALNALMNPHFIFNTLNNVQSLVNENDKVAANKYLRIFADLVRQNMHNVSEELITLQKEMELVSNYLLLEKLRFEDRLTYKINVNEEVDMSDIRIPPLLIQPIVENSIKHGILPLQGKDGLVEINIFELGDRLYIEVKDNGVGLNAAQLNRSSSHESYGMSNIRKRIDQLRIIHGQEITFSLADIVNEDGKVAGTIATITMLLGHQMLRD